MTSKQAAAVGPLVAVKGGMLRDKGLGHNEKLFVG